MCADNNLPFLKHLCVAVKGRLHTTTLCGCGCDSDPLLTTTRHLFIDTQSVVVVEE
jgi:hypothetical protein